MFYYTGSLNPYSARIVPSRFMPTLYVLGNTRYAARQLKDNYRSNYNMAHGYLTNILNAVDNTKTGTVTINGVAGINYSFNLQGGYFKDNTSNKIHHIATCDNIDNILKNATSDSTKITTMLADLKKCVAKLNKMDVGMTVTLGDNLPSNDGTTAITLTSGTEGKITKEEHPYYTVDTKDTSNKAIQFRFHILSLKNKLL
jgi:hypothetical protein